MALSKKYSRKIVVDGIPYRWIFFENDGWNDVTVQSEHGNGAKLSIQVNWHSSDEERQRILGSYSEITPKFVSNAIKLAKGKGWEPDISGAPFTLRLESEKSAPKLGV